MQMNLLGFHPRHLLMDKICPAQFASTVDLLKILTIAGAVEATSAQSPLNQD